LDILLVAAFGSVRSPSFSQPYRPCRKTPGTFTNCRSDSRRRPLTTITRTARCAASLRSALRVRALSFTRCGRERNSTRVPSKSRKSAMFLAARTRPEIVRHESKTGVTRSAARGFVIFFAGRGTLYRVSVNSGASRRISASSRIRSAAQRYTLCSLTMVRIRCMREWRSSGGISSARRMDSASCSMS
jgi:hypothetical protein